MTTIIISRLQEVPTQEQVAEALHTVGYEASVENKKGHATTTVIAEILYAPHRMPIVVSVMNDLIDEPDEGDYEYSDWLVELVPEENVRVGLRRFIFVNHMENADSLAVTTVVDFLRDRTHGLVFTT